MNTFNRNDMGRRTSLGALVTALLTLSGCGLLHTEPPPPPPLRITTAPVSEQDSITPDKPAQVDVSHGKLRHLALTGEDGTVVPGRYSTDRQSWYATEPLRFGTTYTWSGQAAGPAGTRPVAGEFTTVEPEDKVESTINIAEGDEVGIGAPIIVDFDTKIEDKAAAERVLSVTTSKPTEGSWAWLEDTEEGSRAHWRPKEYWKPGTKVAVEAKLYGVPYGDGAHGESNLATHFTVGRAQRVKADVESHQLVVLRDGKKVASYDASYGMTSDPHRTTRGGVHVAMGKSASERMISERFDYDQVMPWAVRMSNNGEYIHANSATVGSQGSSNITHGCVNLSNSNAKEYFDSVLFGDPIEVTNSPIALSESDGDIYDWTVPWEQWRSMSALYTPPAKPKPKPRPAPEREPRAVMGDPAQQKPR